jgi:hypothetical protein
VAKIYDGLFSLSPDAEEFMTSNGEGINSETLPDRNCPSGLSWTHFEAFSHGKSPWSEFKM